MNNYIDLEKINAVDKDGEIDYKYLMDKADELGLTGYARDIVVGVEVRFAIDELVSYEGLSYDDEKKIYENYNELCKNTYDDWLNDDYHTKDIYEYAFDNVLHYIECELKNKEKGA